MKKYSCFLWVLLSLLFLLAFPVFAETPVKVTFINAPSKGTELYITKKVSAPSGIQIPSDSSFSFLLKLDGIPAGEREYRLFHRGKEVFNYDGSLTTEKEANKVPIPFLTDRNGLFSLKAEDSACFGELKAGTHYEISEEPSSGFLQTEPPENIPAMGTLFGEGASVMFHNRYAPEFPSEGKKAVLEIHKQIQFPSGYALPEIPDFIFRLLIDGKPWTGEYYSLADNNTGEIISTDKTAPDGCFVIKGGCFARFEEVPADVDYEVQEKKRDGWRCLSKSEIVGSVIYPVTDVVFVNTEVSFAVTKKTEKEVISDTLFPFVLEKEECPWENAAYYLYSSEGVPLDSEIHHTDMEGKFFLAAGQTAIFTDGDPETVFHVKELPVSDYEQILPQTPEGYQNKVVGSSAEIFPFVNAYRPKKRLSLCIHKVNETGDPLAGAILELYRDRELTELLKQTASDKEGKAIFGDIEPGIYYIKEAVSPAGYRLPVNPVKVDLSEYQYAVNDGAANSLAPQEGEVCVTVYNYRDFRLPLTGGFGTALYLMAGITGILTAVLFLKKKIP